MFIFNLAQVEQPSPIQILDGGLHSEETKGRRTEEVVVSQVVQKLNGTSAGEGIKFASKLT